MVFASRLHDSLSRLDARPVGAKSKTFLRVTSSIFKIHLTMVVLPVPGPPVITDAPLFNDCLTAFA